jgi:hypothetical protein
MKHIYLEEAIRIGEQLLASAQRDEYGISWETMGSGFSNHIFWQKSENIYAGASGIALFFLELYNRTTEKRYLSAAKDAMQWVDWYCKKNPTNYYAFLTGRLGVSFVFLKLYQVTKKRAYLQKALKIAKGSKEYLQTPHKKYEYINGFAGTLLCLLHLHAETQEVFLFDLIVDYTNELVKNARYGKTGLYWDLYPEQIRQLCGFSHGVSGIGFVFLELGRYFKNPAFYFIAEQAFAYDNSYFDEKINNWPDFRVSIYTKEQIEHFEKLYQKGSLKSFIKGKDTNTWCHGAAGIGLSRLRAYEILKKKDYKKDIEYANEKTLVTYLNSFTLCHGSGGNAELFIKSPHAKAVADAALKQKKELGRYINGIESGATKEDPSLFNGIAGIGYFLLRVHDLRKSPSILAPHVLSQTTKKYPVTLSQIKKSLIENIFPRTLQIVNQEAPQQVAEHFSSSFQALSPKVTFIKFIKNLLRSLPAEKESPLADIFALELAIAEMSKKNSSNALLFIKDRIHLQKTQALLKLSDTRLLQNSVVLSEEVKIFTTKLSGSYLLKRTPYGITEIPINQFCELVLEVKSPTLIKNIVEKMVHFYNAQTNQEKKIITEKVLEQIKEAIRNTIVVLPS